MAWSRYQGWLEDTGGDAGSGSDGITAADTPTVDLMLGTPVKAKAIPPD